MFKRPDRPTGDEDGSEQPFNWNEMTTQEQLEFFSKQTEKLEKVDFNTALSAASVAKPEVEVAKKKALVDVPFVILKVKVNMGQFGPFVTLTCVTETPVIQGSDSNTVVINDGSSGIARQCVDLINTYGVDKPIAIQGGLRESVYYVDKATRKVIGKMPKGDCFPQSTFYFNFQKA